jgi:multidrug resistance efflux pump
MALKRVLIRLGRAASTLTVIAFAAFVGWRLWSYYMEAPWTRDGRVRADIVQIAADVSGLITEVPVRDNQHVRRGQLLLVVDRARYELALAQAEAELQTQKALLSEAERERNRNLKLGALVAKESAEQSAARVEQLTAAVAETVSRRDLARLNLERTRVTATVNGALTNMELRPGDYAVAGKPVMALVDADSLHVDGYFEETKLDRVHVGDRAEVLLMGQSRPMFGRVESIAMGIADRERGLNGDLLANVNPTFNWVRLAQRIPVRIVLDEIPPDVHLIVGRTATVKIIEARPNRSKSR